MKNKRRHFSFLFFIASSCLAEEDCTTLLENCAQLQCLWEAQYGVNSPLNAYIAAYRSSIHMYAKRLTETAIARHKRMPNEQLATAQLEANLADVKEHVAALIAQYTNTTQPLSADASSATIQSQDATLQQVLLALQNLQEQQSILQVNGEESLVKQQLLLFGIGILFLGVATYFISRNKFPNRRTLQSNTRQWIKEIRMPHNKKNQAGLSERLGCAYPDPQRNGSA